MKITALGEAFAVAIEDVDVRQLGEAELIVVRDALLRHHVVVLREQKIAPQDQLDFVDRLAPLRTNNPLNQFAPPGFPDLSVISNVVENGRAIGISDAGVLQHSDACFASHPELFACLYAIEVPTEDGRSLGDTVFVSAALAYDALPLALKQTIDGRMVVQSYLLHLERMQKTSVGLTRPPITDEQRAAFPDVEQPIVRVHPITGRRCLYANESFSAAIPGLPEDVGRQILEALCEHLRQPQFEFRQRWRPGDLLVWDNAATQHRAIFDYGSLRRRFHRCSTQGPAPEGIDRQPVAATA